MACYGVRGCRNITVIISIILIIRAVIVLYHGRQCCLKVARSTMPPLNLRDRSNARMDPKQRAFGPSIIGLVRVFLATDSIIATCAPSICARDVGALNENIRLPTNVLSMFIKLMKSSRSKTTLTEIQLVFLKYFYIFLF